MTSRPLLAKEFIIDERQVALAASHGRASALDCGHSRPVILDGVDSRSYGRGCDVLLEVHDAGT